MRGKRMAQDIIEIGRQLITVKAKLPHGAATMAAVIAFLAAILLR